MRTPTHARPTRLILAAALAACATPALAQDAAPVAHESLAACWRQYGPLLIFHPTKCSLFGDEVQAAPIPVAPAETPAPPPPMAPALSPPPPPPPPPPMPPPAPPGA